LSGLLRARLRSYKKREGDVIAVVCTYRIVGGYNKLFVSVQDSMGNLCVYVCRGFILHDLCLLCFRHVAFVLVLVSLVASKTTLVGGYGSSKVKIFR
jgi:hypothetical protein